MKIIVASDSHYERAMLISLVEEIRRRGDIDAVIHLGDMEGDADWLRMIRAHGDEVVAEADDMMPRGFKKTTRDDIRWILNTLGRHMAES